AEGAGAGLEEAGRGFEGDTAGGDELEVGKWGEKRFEIACAAHGRAGKDLYIVRAEVPGGDDLGGGERAGDGEFAGGFGGGDDFGMEAGADDEFGAGF